MDNPTRFVIKVMGISTAIALAIKYGGPLLNLAPSVATSLSLVLIPPLIMAGLLGWQLRSTRLRS